MVELRNTPSAQQAGDAAVVRRGDNPAVVTLTFNNFSATTNPGVGDDSADGYSVGSIWINVTADTIWKCVDASAGAAVWQQVLTDDAGTALTTKSAPVAADEVLIFDSEDANAPKLATIDEITDAIRVADTTDKGLMSAADKTKLDTGRIIAAATTLTSTSNSVAVDLAGGPLYVHELTENTTIAAPTNVVAGQSGCIELRQPASGGPFTGSLNAAWNPAGGAITLSTAANAVDLLTYVVFPGPVIRSALTKDHKA